MFFAGIRLKTLVRAEAPLRFIQFFVHSFKQTFKVFCENTSLHGLKYLVGCSFYGNVTHQTIARIAWAVITLLGIVFTLFMMDLSWMRFMSTPTITTIETTTYPIWNIPFPAVTICNINKVDKSRAKNITNQLVSLGLTRKEATDLLISMASLVNFDSTNDTLEMHEPKFGTLGYNPPKMLLELHQPCESLVKYCYWLGTEVSCAKFFQVTKTHVGFCCSFNADRAMHIDYQSYLRSVQKSFGSIHLSGAGKHVGLSVTIDVQPENYLAPSKSFYGAEVFVHSPKDFPADSDLEDTVQPGWDVDFCVSPLPIDSSPSLKRVPLEQRNCFMENEGKLQSKQTFSLNLCMSECRLRTIIKLCNCVPFFYADFNISEAKGVQYCALQNVNCLRHFRKYFYSLKPPKDIPGGQLNFDLGMDCNCMPSCTFLNYNVQSISSKRMGGPFTSTYFGGRNVSNYATLHVHFKDLYCLKYRREAFMTWDSLLASFGGLFGLCMGGSVLSIVELFYYFIVKPFAFYKARDRTAETIRQQQGSTRSRSSGNGKHRRQRSGLVFRPGRYPVGYFDRKKIVLRERMSGRGKKKTVTQVKPVGSAFGRGSEPEIMFLY